MLGSACACDNICPRGFSGVAITHKRQLHMHNVYNCTYLHREDIFTRIYTYMHFHKSQRHCEVIAFQSHANFHTPRILCVQYAHFSMHAYYSHTLTGRRYCQTSAIQFYANSHTRCIAFSTLLTRMVEHPIAQLM